MDAFYHDLIYFNDFFPHACHDTVQQIVVHVKVREQTVLNVLVLEVLSILGGLYGITERSNALPLHLVS